MATIDITEFGGVAPSVNPRRLGPTRAQVAENLDLRFGDFRPVKGTGANVTGVAAGTKVLFRTPTGVWLSSTSEANYVASQINDSAIERVYVTGNGGYPQVWRGGAYKRLGVPTPTVAPTVAVTVTDEYTYEEQQASVTKWVQDVRSAVLANITAPLIANVKPTSGARGGVWLNHGVVSGMPTTLDSQIVYAVPMTGATTTAPEDAYLLDPLLGGKQITYAGAPHWAVPMLWRPYGYVLNKTALATTLKAFKKPPANTEQMVPNAVADEIAQRIANIADLTLAPLSNLVSRVNSAQASVVEVVLRPLVDPARAYALSEALQRLGTTIQNIDAYFNAFETPMGAVLEEYRYLVPEYTERVLESRFYAYTYVTDWGDGLKEESVLSPESLMVEPDQNDSVAVTRSLPSGADYQAVTHWRLYRSSSTNTGAAWQLVAETAIGTATYTDTKKQEALGEVCPTLTWDEPRADMVGLTGGANGIMVGFTGRILCACVPFTPYAWPREYEQTVAHRIVAVAHTGQSWIVLTEGDTHLLSGVDSAQLSIQKLPNSQACVSKRSVASVAGGALFASPDGVCLADSSGVSVLTLEAINREDWQAMGPASSFAAFSEGVYYLWLPTVSKLMTLDFANKSIGMSASSGVTAGYTDQITDTLYIASGTSLLPMGQGAAMTADWRSGIYAIDNQSSFSWARATGNFTSTQLRVYADGVLVHTIASLAANTPVRMPALRGREWEVRVTGTERVQRVTLASSSAELLR